jgi:hypothetical protein
MSQERRISPTTIDMRKAILSVFLGFSGAVSILLRLSPAVPITTAEAFLRDAFDSVGRGGAVSSGILGIAMSVICYACLKNLGKLNGLNTSLSLFVGTVLSLSLITPGSWGQGAEGSDNFPWYTNSIFLWESRTFTFIYFLRLISLTILFSVILNSCFNCISKREDSNDLTNRSIKLFNKKIIFGLNFRSVFLMATFIFVFWLPILLMNGPVIIPLDTMVQLIQVRGFPAWDPMMMTALPGYHLSDHNPFFDSYIYGFFDEIGILIGNEIVGFILLICLQSFFGALSLSVALCWIISRSSLRNCTIYLLIIIILLVPSFSSYMTVVMKDSTWVPFFTAWFVVFAEIVYRIQNKKVISWKLIIGFILLAILAGLMKKSSLYVSTPATFVLLLYSGYRIKMLIAALLPIIVALLIIPSLLFPMLKIAPGGRQEALGTPIQQVTKVLIDHQSEISIQDIQTISKVFSIQKAKEVWTPTTVDPVKQTFKVQSTKKEERTFLLVWAKLFVKYPVDYFSAVPFIRNAFIIGPTYFTTGSQKCGWSPSGGYAILPKISDCSLSWQQRYLSVPLYDILSRVPPYSLLGAEALYTVWLPLLSAALCVVQKKLKNLMYLLPILFMLIVQLVIPAYQTRYSIGFLFGFAIVIAAPFIIDKNLLKQRSMFLEK